VKFDFCAFCAFLRLSQISIFNIHFGFGRFGNQCGDRADFGAGMACLAERGGFIVKAKKADDGFKAALGKGEFRALVLLLADIDTLAAKYTAVGVVVEARMALIDPGRFKKNIQVFGFQSYLQKPGHVLQGALTIGRAIFTVHLMHRQQQLQGGFLHLPDPRCGGMDNHFPVNRYLTGANGIAGAFDVNETQTAGSWRIVHSIEVAQVRYIDIVIQAGLEQICTFGHFNILVINLQVDHNELTANLGQKIFTSSLPIFPGV
jgi:hypothetical protein